MESSIRASIIDAWDLDTQDEGRFSKKIEKATGSVKAAQVYHALRHEFIFYFWKRHRDKIIENDFWFYWEGKYVQDECQISPKNLARYTNILVEYGLLERKVVNFGGRRGQLTHYRFPDSTFTAQFASVKMKEANEFASVKMKEANSPNGLTGNLDAPLADENSSRARTINTNIKNKNTYGCASTSHCASSPKNSKSGGVLLTVPNYSKNDMKCAQFCFETICKNFPKSNAAKAGWDSLRDEWSATIDKLAKKFTEGDNKRVQAALKWAFGPRNRRNSFLQENIRSLPMLLTKKWKTSDEMEYTFDRLLRDFDADTRIDTEDSLDAKLRTACEKALAEYEQPDYDVDSIMSWIEYLQDEIDKLNNMLPPDKRSSWHRGNGMVKLVQWIIDILEQFEGCSMYDDADSYVDRFFQITQDKIRAGKLKFIWPGYFTDDNGGYVPFERQVMDFYPKIFG